MQENPHILMIDDEFPVRELLAMYFKNRGCKVTTASNYEEAVKLISQTDQGYSLAILDIQLGSKSGLNLIGPLQKHFPKVPIVLFSGLQLSPVEWEKARELGASGYLRKTQPLEEMWAEVQRLCV